MGVMTAEPVTVRMVGGRRMQCKDIPDEAFLDAVQAALAAGPFASCTRWSVQEILEQRLGPLPENLFLAKARKLMAAGKLGGCPCGCRGDYSLPEECGDGHCCRPAT